MKKIYLHLASSMSILGIVTLAVSALAELSGPAVVSSKRIDTAQTVSAASPEALVAADKAVATLKTIPATATVIAPAERAATPEAETTPTAKSRIVTTETMSAAASPDTLAADKAIASLKTIPATTTVRAPAERAATPEPETAPPAALRIVTAQTVSAASPEALVAADKAEDTLKTIPATTTVRTQAERAAIPQDETAPTAKSRIVNAETVSAASPDALIAADKAVATLKTNPATTTVRVPAERAAIPQDETAPTDDSMDQVTSVSQLSDVQPTDWAFQALQSLVERYGCIGGYPDGTYGGNRALTRYEFAAGLNVCLDRVNKLIATATAYQVKKEDITILQQLQAGFSAELATLRSRVDTLEATTAKLEANRFSTTTKLSGLLALAVTGGGFSGDRIVDAKGAEIANKNPNATVLYRVSLNFDTSFSGTDLLKVRFEAGSDGAGDNAAGFLEPAFGSVIDFSYRSPPDNMLSISQLSYTFTPFKNFALTLAPSFDIAAFVDRNLYANASALNFSTNALTNNYVLFPLTPGATAAIDWNPGKGPFKVRAVYLATDAANPRSNNQSFIGPATPLAILLYPRGGGNRGLFGATHQGVVELEYSPSTAFAARLQYSGGNVLERRFDVFGFNFELTLSKHLAIFGRYGYGSYNDTAFGNLNPSYWMAGIAFPDLFVPRALAGIAACQPFIEKGVGNATQTNIEAFYNFPISDNIRITPLVQVITNPANQSSNGTIVTGTLRTVFSF